MIRQPKYFQSKDKPLKVPGMVKEVSSVLPAQDTLDLTPNSTPTSSWIQRHGQHVMLASAIVALIGISGLGILPKVRAKNGFLPMPSIFPESQFNTAVVSQSTSGNAQGLTFDVQVADARVEIVTGFLARYKSPLTPHEETAKQLVAAADRYDLDYRLLPAIMMQESNLGKTSKPELKNPFGFGIHARGELGFESYEAGFDRVAREIKERYIDIGLVTPEQIMTKYTPGSNGSWAHSVNQWIAEMEHNDRDKGLANEGDADLLEYAKDK